MPKKVLIITYYWPPAGGPGVQRWLKFVKYLPDFNIEPLVYCPENATYPITDHSLIDELPEQVTVLKHPIKEPYKWAKLLSKKSTKSISSGMIPKTKQQSWLEKLLLYIRGNYFIPDARIGWVKPSVAYLLKYIKANGIETIITTGPPHSLHLIGLKLKQELGVKWITDFRDPWTTIGYQSQLKLTSKSIKKHEQLEREVLNTTDQIIVTSNHTKKEFESKTDQPVKTITNGYDHHKITITNKDEKFTLSHIGSLLSDRNPEVLWEVLSELIKDHDDFKMAFQLNFAGAVSEDVLNSVYANGLKAHTKVLGYLSHDKAIELQMRSQLLLLIEIDSEVTKAIIPGKLFEYLVSETPILGIGPKDSDIEAIITSTNTGRYFNYQSKDAIKSQILMYFEAYKNRNLRSHAIGLKPYSRRELTKVLAELL